MRAKVQSFREERCFIRVISSADEEGAILLDSLLDALVKESFPFFVEEGGRFVQEEDRGVLSQGQGQEQPLALAGGKPRERCSGAMTELDFRQKGLR
jgi:hypothetical protein